MKIGLSGPPAVDRRLLPLVSLLCLGLLLSGCGISIRAVDPGATSTPTSADQASASPPPASQPTATVAAVLAAEGAGTKTVMPEPPGPTPTSGAEPSATSGPSAPAPTPIAPAPTAATRLELPPTPTPTPSPSRPTPTAVTPSPTPSPSPTPVTLPVCAERPVRGFGLVWSDHPDLSQRIGCPVSPEIGMAARVQEFEHGLMIWLDTHTTGVDSAPWVLALADTSVSRYRVPNEWVTWEAGGLAPTGAFKWVWDNAYADRERLGAPSALWSASDAAMQRFDRGTMIWLKNPPGGGLPTIYVVESDLSTASSGSFSRFLDRSFQ